jgi:signal transduction histidine kinase
LRAITGFAEALREDYDDKLDDAGRDFLNQIITAGGRMNLLIQDLLEYGRVSRVALPLENAGILDAAKQAEHQLGGEKLGALDLAIPRDLEVSAHPQMLSQVLFNLLSNAFKFRAPGAVPEVRVWTEMHDNCVRINVRDNGIGIAHQHQDRIWQVFERLHDRTIYPGSGIGLAIVKRAVTRMGGSYGVESEAGKGSTFWIELPKTSVHSEEATHV